MPAFPRRTRQRPKRYGRVIAIDFVPPEGTVLDDTWGHMVVKAIAQLGIDGVYDVNEVRADGQSIADQEMSHMQFTTGTIDDYTSVIGFVCRPQPND